ncbi:class I SAM-dependent methyltransferase [Leptospira adleri]|uniref:2-polyprenyl-3-methyl-5-hydroxy-6-metoxy-1, 4-benzoquinol methylase n=1 Tax=Leptospira adleri TaxID=2023186 RepID=A0A2M9YRI6_9LEPT|nr:class I SAM-dependent methyltransferase [Leptospira adleri]PJZ54163.1 2-polyprenyl-3-methyl-5-hydroxy-6-metoxy-1,4-benzoquinol methylase [Leptospira adleri]PJZ62657.1 2-polyprenyl-3-methyl-5-hydroxy-6-metoxy-1,4-benzoquinol methylase [Leptospira adleri]
MFPKLELIPHPRFPDQYRICKRTGVCYYKPAQTREYKDSYFLDEYKNQYQKTYYEDEESLRGLARKRLEMIGRFQNPKDSSLFELGSAAGFFLDEARKKGYRVSGLEISPAEVEYSRKTLGLDVLCASFLEENVLKGASFDAVAAFFVVEHFPDADFVFEKLTGLVKPGGFLFLGLPSLNGPTFQTNPEEWFRTHPKDHFWDYSPASLKKMLKGYGFTTEYKKPMSYHPSRDRGWRGKILSHRLFARLSDLTCYGDTFHLIAQKQHT